MNLNSKFSASSLVLVIGVTLVAGSLFSYPHSVRYAFADSPYFGTKLNLSDNFVPAGSVDVQMVKEGSFIYTAWVSDEGTQKPVYFSRSINDGTSFEPKVGFTSDFNNFPRLAADGSNVVLVWQDDTAIVGNSEIFLVYSTDNGNSFSSVINVSNTPGFSHEPSVALLGNIAVIVWLDDTPGSDHVMYGERDLEDFNGGNGDLSNTAGVVNDAKVVAGSDAFYITWSYMPVNGTENQIAFAASTDSSGVAYRVNLGGIGLVTHAANGPFQSIIAACCNTVTTTGPTSGVVFYKADFSSIDPTVISVSTPVASTPPGPGVTLGPMSASITPTGPSTGHFLTMMVPFSTAGPVTDVFLGNITTIIDTTDIVSFTGRAPVQFVNLSDNTEDAIDPSISASGTDVSVAWAEDVSFSNYDIMTRSSTDGGIGFGGPVNISNDLIASSSPSVVTDSSNVYVAWNVGNVAVPPGNVEVGFVSSDNNGATFSSPENLSASAGFSGSFDLAAVGDDVAVVWEDDTGLAVGDLDVLIRTSDDGGATFGSTVNVSNNTSLADSAPKVLRTSSDVYVAWDGCNIGVVGCDIFFAKGTFPSISFSVDNPAPRWGIDNVTLSGITQGDSPGDSVSIEWGDGIIDSGIAIVAGNWSATHVYAQSAVGTNTIVATLIDNATSAVKATSPQSFVDVQPHSTALTLDSIQNVTAGTRFAAGGTLFDIDAGVEVPGKEITFAGSTPPAAVTTEGVIFSSGVEIASCPSCVPDSVGNGTKMLRMKVGDSISLPFGTNGTRMFLQGMGTNEFEVAVSQVKDSSVLTETSFGSDPDVSIFEIYSPLGIQEIEISMINASGVINPPGATVNLTAFGTFDTDGDPQDQRKFNFEVQPLGVSAGPLVLQSGSFFSIGTSDPAPADGLSLVAVFDGDQYYRNSASDSRSFHTVAPTIPVDQGTAGEGTTILTGDTVASITKIACASDTDGDGLCNSWETAGQTIPYGGARYNLYNSDITPPNSSIPDIYVEIDYMTGHRPDIATVINPVKSAFSSKGVTLHVIVDETLIHVDNLNAWSDPGGNNGNSNDDFDSIKKNHFGRVSGGVNERAAGSLASNSPSGDLLRAKANAYHYGVIAHGIGVCPGSISGLAELPGNDFIVSLGCNFGTSNKNGGHPDGTIQEQQGTIMHELGHNLKLRHGGGDDINCKPNYPSVMSYTRQFPTYPGWVLDYSGKSRTLSTQYLGTINEDILIESSPLKRADGSSYGTPIRTLVWYSNGLARTATTDQAAVGIDWSGNGGALQSSALNPDLSINTFPGLIGCDTSSITVLNGHNDWAKLGYNFRTLATGLDGVHPAPATLAEQTGEMVQKQTLLASQFSGILQPINPDGSSVFKKGSTVSVKFALFDVDGNPITDASATLRLERIANGITGSDSEAISTSSASTGNEFRYDAQTNTYVFNWGTSDLQTGTYALRIYLEYGEATQSLLGTVNVSIKR